MWRFSLLLVAAQGSVSQLPSPGNMVQEPDWTAGTPWKVIQGIHDGLVGRVLGTLIRPGMTGEQVDRIVGEMQVDIGQFGPGNRGWFGYSRYGLIISWAGDDSDPRKSWRVRKVSYCSQRNGER